MSVRYKLYNKEKTETNWCCTGCSSSDLDYVREYLKEELEFWKDEQKDWLITSVVEEELEIH